MATLKVLEDICQLTFRRDWIKHQNAIDDVVRARLVGRVEIPGLGGGLERAHDHARRIRMKEERLTVEKRSC